MPLVVDGIVLAELPLTTRSLFETYPRLKEVSSSLLFNQQSKVVGPVGLLYVNQREFAATTPHDKNVSILGSDDATTCLVAVIRHTGSGAVCLCHIDSGSAISEGARDLLKKVQDLSINYPDGRYELHVVGGFQDSHGYSEENSISLLHAFHKLPEQIDLVLACICELNSTHRGGICWPKFYGLGVNVKTGEIFPATFPDKGPEMALRSARHFTGAHQMLDVYDCHLGLLRIGPFSYEPLRGVDLWLEQADDFILRHLSTSPEVEPPHFVLQVRASLKYIRDHPFPLVTIFRDNRPHFYRKDENGAWLPVN